MNRIIIILFFSILLLGCEKNDIDPLYPTVINKLNSTELSQKKADYQAAYPYMFSSINEFGFFGSTIDPFSIDQPPVLSPLKQEEAIALIKNFVSLHPSETGVKNPEDLIFDRMYFSTGLYNGGTSWNIRTRSQKIDTIEVKYTDIIFNLTNRELVSCTGNWYPEIYIPERFRFNLEKAKSILINHVVSHYTIAGQEYKVNVTSGDVSKSVSKLVIYPKTTKDKIELHVTWQINVPGPVYYIFYIDVMSGEIIVEEPTIIS
jgi:hypothetical protein